MKKEELFDLLEDIDPASVSNARGYRRKKNPVWMKWTAVAACAAILVGAAFGLPALQKGGQNGVNPTQPSDVTQQGVSPTYPSDIKMVLAAYPKPVAQNLSAQEFLNGGGHWDWVSSHRELVDTSHPLQAGMSGYYTALMGQLLVSQDENTVCSPVNTYVALAMLAEVSGGTTRQQILDLLGVADLDTLSGNISALWNSNYVDTPALKSVLANSMWLNQNITYHDDTLNRLAEQYYASSFVGDPASDEMNQALRKWTDDNTGGLLTEYTKDMSMDEDTALDLLSTIYYKAMWADDFNEEATQQQTFHGTAGKTKVDMMRRSEMMNVYRTQSFTALGLSLRDSGSMYFFLPTKHTDVNALVSDPDMMKVLQVDDNDPHWSFPTVHLSIPKFKVSGNLDLRETLRTLGVTDALNPSLADFTPLTPEAKVRELYLSKADHAAMVEIDEHGVTGAAYTEAEVYCGSALPEEEIDFVLDRPFLFLITGSDGSILFSGIVRNIA